MFSPIRGATYRQMSIYIQIAYYKLCCTFIEFRYTKAFNTYLDLSIQQRVWSLVALFLRIPALCIVLQFQVVRSRSSVALVCLEPGERGPVRGVLVHQDRVRIRNRHSGFPPVSDIFAHEKEYVQRWTQQCVPVDGFRALQRHRRISVSS